MDVRLYRPGAYSLDWEAPIQIPPEEQGGTLSSDVDKSAGSTIIETLNGP